MGNGACLIHARLMSTMTDDPTAPPPPDGGDAGGDYGADPGPEPAAAPVRTLRRSTDDRVVVGVAGGLGHYFDVDPILFRVLFATTAFFGGVGLLAYLLAWALIPEEGSVDPPVDRLVDNLRDRGLAFWIVLGTLSVIFWIAVLPDWSPFGFGPIAIAAVILAIALSKRSTARSTGGAGPAPAPPSSATPAGGADGATPDGVVTEGLVAGTPTVPHDAPAATAPEAEYAGYAGYTPAYSVTDPTQAFGPPPEPPEVRKWEAQARIISARTAARESQRAARKERRQRMSLARWGSFGALVATLAVCVVLDATRGIPISTYGWAMVAVGLASLVIGGLFRRTPWLNVLWVLVGLSIIATFGTSSASLADGTGDRLLVPRSEAALPDDVRLAFGRTTVDLTELPAGAGRGHTLEIHQAAGLVVVQVPQGMRVAIHAGVHFGAVEVDEDGGLDDRQDPGRQFDEGPTGSNVFTIDAHLAVGVIEIDHVTPEEEAAAQEPVVRESQSGPTTPADEATPPDPVTPADPVTPDTTTGRGTR